MRAIIRIWLFFFIPCGLFLQCGYYGTIDETTEIGYFEATFSPEDVDSIVMAYSIPDSIVDSYMWNSMFQEIKGMPFNTDVIFFAEQPQELVGIDFNRKCIRYVYNPGIHHDILVGGSPKLDTLNQKRIVNRVEAMF